jgi:glycosyltransferase 2 family protein
VTAPNARRWLWAVKVAATLLVLALIGRSLARNWAAFRSLQITLALQGGWLAASAVAVFATYAIQIESWRRVLGGWGQRLPYAQAARAWCLANLARYIPGKVWGVASLVVLAQRAGVQTSAAAASAFGMQALALGTGVVLIALATPHAAPPLPLGVAVLGALATVSVLAWGPTARWLGRLASATTPLPPLPVSAVASGSSLMLLSWVTYGAAFWLLARGLIPASSLPLPTAMGLFALGYILGVLALFAPSGVGVRELALIGFLTPVLGSGGALALSVGSRVLLTLTEVAAAAASLILTSGSRENASEHAS